MKKLLFLTFAAIIALALMGCETTTETNSNNAIVVNDNANTVNTNKEVAESEDDDWDWSNDVKREDFDKDKDKYKKKSEEEKATIGDGANDLWIWTKTRAALATTDDLRDSTINVDVVDEVITLKGTVGSKKEKDAAVKVANGIEGKKSVKDELKVAKDDSITNMNTTDDEKGKTGETNKEEKK